MVNIQKVVKSNGTPTQNGLDNELSRYADFNEPFSIESFFKQTKVRFKEPRVSFSHLPFCGACCFFCWGGNVEPEELVNLMLIGESISMPGQNQLRSLGCFFRGFGGWWRAMLVPRHKPCNIAGWELHYVKMYLLSKTVVFHCYVRFFGV